MLPGEEVTVIAVPNDGYFFVGWYVGEAETAVSANAFYTFIVCGDLFLKARFERNVYNNSHTYVDLGLPSGVKWATCNVGANAPEEYGGYYAWGETEEKQEYSINTYKWYDGSNGGVMWVVGSQGVYTKYCLDWMLGAVDNKAMLDPEDDVAHVKWGGSWRMPTISEFEELRDECVWEDFVLNGINGCRVIGPNGDSIFLPATGHQDVNGYYWSSSLHYFYSDCACGMDFVDSHKNPEFGFFYGRESGLCIRPVCE